MTNITKFNILRLAVIKSVDYKNGKCCIQWLDRVNEKINVPLPNIFCDKNSCIKVGIGADAIVLLGSGINQQYYIIATVELRGFLDDNYLAAETISSSQVPNPTILREGEIIIKSIDGSVINFNAQDGIQFSNSIKEVLRLGAAKNCSIIFSEPDRTLQFSEAGKEICGTVKRVPLSSSTGEKLNPGDELDFFNNRDFDVEKNLVEIGINPDARTAIKNSIRATSVKRNVPFVERRETTLEFAASYNFTNLFEEQDIINNSLLPAGFKDNEKIYNSNYNVVNQSTNDLIEIVKGTLFDSRGNLLDINLNIINRKKLNKYKTVEEFIKDVDKILRRSVAYHFSINTRANKILSNDRNNFNIDIDKEGLVKIHIPASSNIGNIPRLLQRSVDSIGNSTYDAIGPVGEDQLPDDASIKIQQGIPINNSEGYTFTPAVTGTAYHNIFNVAEGLISKYISKLTIAKGIGGKNTERIQKTDTTPKPQVPNGACTVIGVSRSANVLSNIISNDPQDLSANAGGRSLNMALDGSIELSIGKDNADGKSFVLDTAGALIAWFGADKNGRSIVAQTDGNVLLEVGRRPKTNAAGKKIDLQEGEVNIYVNVPTTGGSGTPTSPDGAVQIISITKNGIVISSNNGSPVSISSTGDICLDAGGSIILKGSKIVAQPGTNKGREVSAIGRII